MDMISGLRPTAAAAALEALHQGPVHAL